MHPYVLGGIGRAVVEGPFEMIKIRKQVQKRWGIREVMNGFGATLLRNAFLFSSFVIYIDISRQFGGLSPFWTGGICANLAWLTIWPLDVVKSRIQSGNYDNKAIHQIFADAGKSRHLFSGLLPGLIRSFIANGSSMVVYTWVEKRLKEASFF